jgi:hypothetical protein
MAQPSTVAGFPLACHAEAYASPARTEVMSILQTQPDAKEVCVKKVYPLRFAGDPSQEKYDQLFQLAQRFDAQVERTAPLGKRHRRLRGFLGVPNASCWQNHLRCCIHTWVIQLYGS